MEEFPLMIQELLSNNNKDKLLGEISREMEQQIFEIKSLIDSGVITHETLKYEISNNITDDKIIPGTVAQMLIGCIDEKSCPMKEEQILDIPYYYDSINESLIPLSRITEAITTKSYAVIYMTGYPQDLNYTIFLKLKEDGFNRAKIMHKKSSTAPYKEFIIDDFIFYTNPANDYVLTILFMCLACMFIYGYYRT